MPTSDRDRPIAVTAARWTPQAEGHARRVDDWVAGHRRRAGIGERHPVEDFLFTYYSLRPARLRRWHPGLGRALLGDEARSRLSWRWYAEVDALDEGQLDGHQRVVRAVGLDVDAFLHDRTDAVTFVRDLLTAVDGRPAQLGCFGLHEWAMAYRRSQAEVRHDDWPLRLGSAGTDAVVETHQIRCTHYDAYRFFTPEALSRNLLQPTRHTQVRDDQPGCLHVGMDLYKWAYKLGPLVPGELLLDCFSLARDIRTLDMRASPYDLAALGYSPVKIETPQGKTEYVSAQRSFAERAAPLRRQLIEVSRRALAGPRPRPRQANAAEPAAAVGRR